ncbi:large conductance mechanosensitive channel protein MscL [Herbidospora sp. NBRC 101105]|uniref:large conductance mechanosensitive channel protein MscL n=1 Tax=Herbidospora sp. NBRC 101105 TaxID=3032195 RepID=UPI00249FA4E3|nr:large conductance mechanosensitive channel protein MscL [Herbidospora sp. NBRC 101105]GLX98275.1 large-conductance mechanosensitive channel [Herbidospora sp. NBRC 101105]
MSGFKKFLLRGNIVELAVAVVIGAAFGGLVQAVVADFITPLVKAITGGAGQSFGQLKFTVNGSDFAYGHFLNTLLSFLIIAAVVYWLVVTPMTRLIAMFEKDKVATEKKCPECLSDVPVEARRCAFCTSDLTPAAAERPPA